MKVLALLLCALYCASAFPTISETFQAKVTITVNSHTRGNDTGSGVWASDAAAKSTLENYAFNKGTFDSFSLNRYDLGKLYRVFSTNKSRCEVFPTEDEMPNEWAWLSQTKFVGSETYNGNKVDVWESTVGFAERRIAVWSSNTSVPAWISNKGTERDTITEFASFTTDAPATSVFTVPSTCQATYARGSSKNNVQCRASAAIMSDAEIWVANHVPYNQDGTYMSYREDCSGYVSFTWQAGPPGRDTMDFHLQSHPISKADLTPGDCLLYAAEHVVLFGGWADAGKTSYWAYEETKPGTGTIKSVSPYPYFYDPSDFLPYRYDSFC